MLANFLKVIVRYFLRSRLFAALNILGLSVGIGCCIVIYLFVKNELSYDRFQPDDIYRVIRQSAMNNMPYKIGITSGPFAKALQLDFGNRLSEVTRAMVTNGLVRYQDKTFMEDRLVLADSNFFQFFSYPLIHGDAGSVLSGANNIVITKEFSIKYFGDENPMGKMIRLDNRFDLQVSGVMDDLPGNTHLQFDAIASLGLIERESWFNEWWNNGLNTYVKVPTPNDADFLNKAFPKFMDKYFGKDFERMGTRIGLSLEPIQEIYFNYDTRYDQNISHGDKRYLLIFGSIGFIMILLAAINYINLATAQASQRAKEVGVRKTLGSSKSQIALQFLSESFFFSFVSLVIGLALAQAAIPLFNANFGIAIPDIFSDRRLIYFLGGLLALMGLLAGGYPSFLLASFTPFTVLRGQLKSSTHYLFVRKSLVVFQFGVSVFMIIATLFIGRQLEFMKEKDLGFKPDKVVLVQINNDVIQDKRQDFKKQLLQRSEFESASFASGHPGGFYDATTVRLEAREDQMRMRTLWSDEDLARTMGFSLAAGRFFSREFPADSTHSVLLNETAVRQLGWKNEEALGKRVSLAHFGGDWKEIIGVVKDYHFTTVKEKIEPLIVLFNLDRGRQLLVRLSGNNLVQSVDAVQKIWDSYGTGFPMELVFLDDTLARLYKTETVQGKMFSIFSFISVLIAGLGILGLASFMAAQRRKEIGIRKVLGATSQQLSMLLMQELIALVLIADLIAIPLGYWAIREWSQGFAYRVTMSPVTFIAGAVIVLLIALIIVGVNASRAAFENPVHSLRSE